MPLVGDECVRDSLAVAPTALDAVIERYSKFAGEPQLTWRQALKAALKPDCAILGMHRFAPHTVAT